MIYISAALTVLFFTVFATLDGASLFPRISGSICGSNAIGASVQAIVNAFKRVFVVSFAPLLGYIQIVGTHENLIFVSVTASVVGGVAVFLCLLARKYLIVYFCQFIVRFSNSGSLIKSMSGNGCDVGTWDDEANAVARNFSVSEAFRSRKNRKVFMLSLWIFTFYSSSIFVLNIIAHSFSDYASVVVQMTGLANAFGTLALAFILDPLLARSFEARDGLDGIILAMLLGRITSLIVAAPSIYLLLGYTLA